MNFLGENIVVLVFEFFEMLSNLSIEFSEAIGSYPNADALLDSLDAILAENQSFEDRYAPLAAKISELREKAKIKKWRMLSVKEWMIMIFCAWTI